MQVSVRELKNNLSKYLHALEYDGPIVITSHRRPLAKIVPIITCTKTKFQLSHIEGIQWNGKKPVGNKNAPKIRKRFASDYVIEDRG